MSDIPNDDLICLQKLQNRVVFHQSRNPPMHSPYEVYGLLAWYVHEVMMELDCGEPEDLAMLLLEVATFACRGIVELELVQFLDH